MTVIDALPAPPGALSRQRRHDRTLLLQRISLAVLLLATAVLYIWGLSASGWANSFYSAAAQAGGQDWKAWFFGSLDSGNSITVDKPPASLWVMGLSVRLFGLSSWSILVPQAIMGVLTAWLVFATTRRALRTWTPGSGRPLSSWSVHNLALFGAAAFALTPVAVLMFRFNNPDALLMLLLTAATYCLVRATETASRRWMVWAGVAIGFAFLTKTLQAFLILPPLALAYLIMAPASWRKRVVDLLAAAAALAVSAGWYIAVFTLTPASMRPYMGGSQTNSFLELAFGYNGLGRLTGDEVGSVGGGNGGTWGSIGILRLFTGVSGGMVAWLIPAALVLAVVGVVLLGRRMQDGSAQVRGALIASGGSLLVTGLVFSFMAGIYHDYYTVALTPFIGITLALGAGVAWAHRERAWVRGALAVAAVATGALAVAYTSQAGGVYAVVGWVSLGMLVLAALGFVFGPRLAVGFTRAAVALSMIGALLSPASYALQTAATAHTGSIVTAGPVTSSMGGRGGGGMADGGQRGQGNGTGGTPPGDTAPGGTGQGAPTQGGTTQGGTAQNGPGSQGGGPGRTSQGSTQGGSTTDGRTGGAGMGGLLTGTDVSDELKAALTSASSDYTWVAATIGSQNAASYQLATNLPVMAIGGFNGSDPSPTLEQFQAYVAQGKIHYFIGGEMGGRQNGGSEAASDIVAWVEANYEATTIGSTTVYDLSGT
ncbi:MAG TPA: glycosyltransferase family 39 protein [Propioniciclava sp.]|uniref:ArnT family glycosyltransferase n=1 Tax=Propioniciclava sp. TaxID=2038686 RepID=UPI002D0F063B|nr:glycosyltransferase family 39 protein [Propioniciclava sp.]HRL48604.1 glycosyltransferase family 39 protein [Propioniciclava sp.]